MKINTLSSKWTAELKTAFRYGMVGISNTIIFTLSVFILRLTNLHYTVYTAISYGIAILFSFFMNLTFTFKADRSRLLFKGAKFFLVALTLLALVELIQLFLIEIVLVKELFAVLCGMVFYTISGFLLNRFWVYK